MILLRVLKNFRCKETNEVYKAGTEYEGNRLKELQKLGYVAPGDEPPGEEWPKHLGGGHYELSNGEKVKGKEAALVAQAEIDDLLDD